MLQLKLNFKVNEDWNWPYYLSFLLPFLLLYLSALWSNFCVIFCFVPSFCLTFILTCFLPVLRVLKLIKCIMLRLISKFLGLLASYTTCVSLPIWCIAHCMITKFRVANNFPIVRCTSTNISHHLKWAECARIWCQKHCQSVIIITEQFSISKNDSSFCITSQRRVQYHFRVCVNILKCLISVISVSRHVIAVFFFSFLPPGATLECVACICSVQKLVIASDEAV